MAGNITGGSELKMVRRCRYISHSVAQARQTHPAPRGGRHGGFTLVELLVVIGIIAVLIAILLPALSRAREMAKQIRCLSNIRQVGMSIAMYTNNNKGFFPAPSNRFPFTPIPWDWVYFRPEQGPTQNSAIAPYLWSQWADGQVPPVMICPSDDNTYRPATFNNEPYPYSYAMNATVAGVYNNYKSTMNVAQISDTSEKIVLIEETEDSLNDGNWWPFGYDLLSVRHDHHLGSADSYGNDTDHRGNVAFVDGHAAFETRAYVQDPKHWDATLP